MPVRSMIFILSFTKLLFNVQSLETLGKLRQVNGYVRMCLEKLEGIRGDLVRTDDDWCQWDFPKLVDALRKWTERNPVKTNKLKKHASSGQTNASQVCQHEAKQIRCVYCNEISHTSVNCPDVVTSGDRMRDSCVLIVLGLNTVRPNAVVD